MKQFRSILSYAFILLVVFSSTSFMVGIQLCNGHIQDVALFAKAKGCDKVDNKTPLCQDRVSNHCCEHETIIHDARDFKEDVSHTTIVAPDVLNVAVPATFISEIIPTSIRAFALHVDYDPPVHPIDVTTDLQVFLI